MPKSIRCQRLSTEDVEIAIICPDCDIGIRRPVSLIEHVFDQVFVAVETESDRPFVTFVPRIAIHR